jgi:rhodanese-related sulfurtransferase
MGNFLISVQELKGLIGNAEAPQIFDVRRREVFDSDARVLPTARWREHTRVGDWARQIPGGGFVVCYCAHGHNVSQLAVAALRARGINAHTLAGGIEAWQQADGPIILKAALPGRDENRPSRWVTRTKPKIDRIACPWLIRRFIDREAEFLFVEPAHVRDVAGELGAIPFDVDGAELSHVGPCCTFDTLIDRFGLVDPALDYLRLIVRGADTAQLDLAPEAAGLLAVSLGVSVVSEGDDHVALECGMPVYDALYAWRTRAATETHNWPVNRAT